MKLSILIPSLHKRETLLGDLLGELYSQKAAYGKDIEIIVVTDSGEVSIGEKRNQLMERAKGDYVCYIDDDDSVSQSYIHNLMDGVALDVDCCSLMGVYTIDGKNPELFEHSIKYTEWKTNPPTMGIRYERNPNHLNCIKRSIASKFKFPEIYHGEDHEWSRQLQMSGLLKTEHSIMDVLYSYRHNRK